jgi:hypothetical protein
MQRLLYGFRQALQSPSRNPRTAVALGRLLATAFIVCFLTGIYSHFIQDPLPGMQFLTRPVWLYQFTQGLHITTGILCFPLLFEIATGLLNTYQWYSLFGFSFRRTHFALAFIIIGSLAIHIAVKLPIITKYWRKSTSYDADGKLIPLPETPDTNARLPLPDIGIGITSRVFAWIDKAPPPQKPQVSRRGFFTTIGLAGLAVTGLTVGQSFRPLDALNVFGPRKAGVGPNALPVNRTAHAAKVLTSAVSPDWKLTVSSSALSRSFSRAELESMEQHQVDLPIACVEGWSQMAHWKGVRLRDLVERVDGSHGAWVRATSLEQGSIYAVTELEPNFVRDELTLIALELNGETLDIDHGYPARLIAPARPGVLQTKWLSKLETFNGNG